MRKPKVISPTGATVEGASSNGAVIGYARTSTIEQMAGIEAQERDLRAAGCTRIFAEQVSSVATLRPQLAAAFDYLRAGDVLVVTKPDRLARSTADLLGIMERLNAKEVGLRILSMGGAEMDTRSATGKLMLTMLGAVATFERELMLERQREGIRKAAEEGKYKGRAPTARRQAAQVNALKAEGVGPAEIARRLGIGRASVYRIIAGETAGDRAPGPTLPA
jgi:DNA invertase Pin-like site-specific DNA recombinase